MKKLKLTELTGNTGQIEGLPANPRTINKDDYQKLLNSLEDDADFLNHEKLHVIKHKEKFVVLNGNMRLRALKELGYKEVPVEIYDEELLHHPDVLKARIIKSNHGYGDDDMDMLANDGWDMLELKEWGMDFKFDDIDNINQEEKVNCPQCGSKVSADKIQ